MRRILQLLIFVSLFFLGFLFLNYYIIYGLGNLLGFKEGMNFYLGILIASVSYPTSMVLERTLSNWFSRILYFIASSWVGVAFFLLWGLIIYQISSLFFKIPPLIAGVIIIGCTLLISTYSLVKGQLLEVEKIQIPLKNLPKTIKAVQISDIHIGAIRNNRFLERVLEKVNTLNPDIIFITGDLFDGSSKIQDNIIKSLKNFKSPVLFVTGNHDYFQGLDEVMSVLDSTEFRVLRNEKMEFKGLQIIGVDYSFNNGYLHHVLENITWDKNRPSVLLYHIPQNIRLIHNMGIKLHLAGHTHSGQFYPFNILVKLIFPYFKGLYQYNDTFLYVSQGTGTWGPPMRLGSSCEITQIELLNE